MTTVLLIDAQESMRQDLSNMLSEITPLNILLANSADLVDSHSLGPIDLAVVSTAKDMTNNLPILHYLDDHQIPTIAYGTISTRDAALLDSFAVFHHINEPFKLSSLSRGIKKALQHPEEAHISGVSLPSFLQLIELDRKTCTLRIKSDNRRGVLYFIDGEISNADTEDKSGEEAALEIIDWHPATIDLHAACRKQNKEIESTLGFLLIESSRRHDENKRQVETAPEIPSHLENICQRLDTAISELAPESSMLIARADGTIIIERHKNTYINKLTIQTAANVSKLNALLNYSTPQYILLHHHKDKKLLILPGLEIIIGLEIAVETPAQIVAASLTPLLQKDGEP